MANLQLLPYAQQVAAIERQRKLADLLQQQGMEQEQTQTAGRFVVPTSPWQTVAKLAQAGLGAYLEGKAAKREGELDTQQREEAKKAIQDFMAASGPQKTVTQTPVMEQDFGQAATPEDYQNMMNDPQMGLAPKRRDVSLAETPEDVQDILNQPYVTKDVTSYTPGLSRNEQIAKLLEMQAGGNKYVSAAVPTLTGLLSKSPEVGAVNPADWTPASLAKYASTGNYNDLVPKATEAKTANLQRDKRTYIGAGGKEFTQDVVFDPITGTSKDVGTAYVSKAAPTEAKDTSTQAGATLRSEYNNHPIVKNHAIVSSAYENILNNQETGAGDMALIFQYMKMLDPNSAVREGEYATAENSGSIPQSVRNYYNRAISGERLQPEQRSAFINQAKDIYQTSAQQVATVRQGIEQIGRDTGVNPRLYPLPEPKRRTPAADELPAGFVLQPEGSQNTINQPSGSLMFQFPRNK